MTTRDVDTRKLYRVTALVWAQSEDDAASTMLEEGDTTAHEVAASDLAESELRALPIEGPGHWTAAQLLAGEHLAPPPGPPESLAPGTLSAWLALPGHWRAPLLYAGALDDGRVYWTDGRGILAAQGTDAHSDLGHPAKGPASIARVLASECTRSAHVTWAEIDRVCGACELSERATTVVRLGAAYVDAAQLRRWAWGAAAVAREDVTIESAGPLEAVRVRGATWRAVVMPVRDAKDVAVIEMVEDDHGR